MADCYTELRQQNVPDIIASLDASDKILHQLLQAESTERSIRSIRYQTNAARFPVLRHLQGFDFSQSKVDQQLINLLATMQFTEAIQTWCWLVVPELVKRIWPSQSVFQAYTALQ